MAHQLRTLLELRRQAEDAARVDLDQALAARAKADEEEARLRQALRVARAALRLELRSPRATPKSAAEAQRRERYRERRAEEARGAAQALQAYLDGPWTMVVRGEDAARAAYHEAHQDLEAALKLHERSALEVARQDERRDEDRASDHTNALFVQGRKRESGPHEDG